MCVCLLCWFRQLSVTDVVKLVKFFSGPEYAGFISSRSKKTKKDDNSPPLKDQNHLNSKLRDQVNNGSTLMKSHPHSMLKDPVFWCVDLTVCSMTVVCFYILPKVVLIISLLIHLHYSHPVLSWPCLKGHMLASMTWMPPFATSRILGVLTSYLRLTPGMKMVRPT